MDEEVKPFLHRRQNVLGFGAPARDISLVREPLRRHNPPVGYRDWQTWLIGQLNRATAGRGNRKAAAKQMGIQSSRLSDILKAPAAEYKTATIEAIAQYVEEHPPAEAGKTEPVIPRPQSGKEVEGEGAAMPTDARGRLIRLMESFSPEELAASEKELRRAIGAVMDNRGTSREGQTEGDCTGGATAAK